MSTLNPHESPEMPGWLKVLVWLGVFLSPTEFILLLMIMDMRHVPAPADVVVVSLFILIPVAALLACETWYGVRSLQRDGEGQVWF